MTTLGLILALCALLIGLLLFFEDMIGRDRGSH